MPKLAQCSARVGQQLHPGDKDRVVAKKTEYLITQHARDGSIIRQLRVPKGVNLRILLERLISQGLNDDEIVASSLRSNSSLFYDPFQIIDMRDEHRRDQARDALSRDPDTKDPLGVYNRARAAPIPLGKTLIFAGANYDFSVKEVAA